MLTPVRVTLPVFVPVKVYVIVLPTAAGDWTPDASAVFVRVSSGPATNGLSVDAGGASTSGPDGGVPELAAVFATCPPSMSAWVSAYVAVAVTDWPGDSVPTAPGHA